MLLCVCYGMWALCTVWLHSPTLCQVVLLSPALHLGVCMQIYVRTTFLSLSGFPSEDCLLLFSLFFLTSYFARSFSAADVTWHILTYPSHHFNCYILLTFTVATVDNCGDNLEWIYLASIKTTKKSKAILCKRNLLMKLFARGWKGNTSWKLSPAARQCFGDTIVGWQLHMSCQTCSNHCTVNAKWSALLSREWALLTDAYCYLCCALTQWVLCL